MRGNKQIKNIDRKIVLARLKEEWKKAEAQEKREKIFNQVKIGSKEAARYLLAGAAVCGILTVAVVAPNIFSAFGKMGLHRRFYKKDDFQKAYKNLKQQRLIKVIKKENGNIYFSLTEKAKQQLIAIYLGKMQLKRSDKWDGLWRIVIFDIPKKYDNARDALRYKLKNLDFFQLQRSIFISPFECKNEIKFLKDLYGVGDYVKLIRANYIDGADELKEKFSII